MDKLKDVPNSLEVHQATGDADLLIVQTAVKYAINVETVVVWEDTDLFILLLHHAKADDNNIYFTSEPKNGKSRKVWNVNIIKKHSGKLFAIEYCFAMLYLVATRRQDFLELEKDWP
jgi:hypothetical protein